MISEHKRTRPDAIGGSVWPLGNTGFANLFPADRRAYAVILAPLLGSLQAGTLRLAPGASGVFPLAAADDGLPVRDEWTDAADAPRVVFLTQ
jgi:hypothetical protein